jgi:hypothetical protein
MQRRCILSIHYNILITVCHMVGVGPANVGSCRDPLSSQFAVLNCFVWSLAQTHCLLCFSVLLAHVLMPST